MLVIFAAVIATVYVARSFARSYASKRLGSEQARTRAAIHHAEAVYKSAQADVRRYAEQRSAELDGMRTALRAKLTEDEHFYADVRLAISTYLDQIAAFDNARRKVLVLEQQLRESRSLLDQLALAQAQDRQELVQIDQALGLLRQSTNFQPRFDLIALHHPELATGLMAAGTRLEQMRRVLREWGRQCDKDEMRTLDSLLELLDEQSAIADEVANLKWARGDVTRRYEGLKRRCQTVEAQVKKVRMELHVASTALKATFPAGDTAAQTLESYAEVQYQQARRKRSEEIKRASDITISLNVLHDRIKTSNEELKKLRSVGGTSIFDGNRFAQIKGLREAAKAELTPLKKRRIDHQIAARQYADERDLWQARRQYVNNFFAETGQEDMAPSKVRHDITWYAKRGAGRLAATLKQDVAA